jgi:hypothetical protein
VLEFYKGWILHIGRELRYVRHLAWIVPIRKCALKPVFHFNCIVTYRSIFFCVEVISSTLVVRKQRNTLRYDTVEVENRLKAVSYHKYLLRRPYSP